MKKITLPLIFILLILFSCRKQEAVSSLVEQARYEKLNKFFHQTTATHKDVTAVKGWLERAIGNTTKLDLYVQRAGYPNWDHSMVISQKAGAIQTENTNNTGAYNYVYVPFVKENEKLVNSIMAVRFNETDTTNTFLMDWQYQNYGFAESGFNAKEAFTYFLIFNESIFQYHDYLVPDGRLFGFEKEVTLTISVSPQNGPTTESDGYYLNICYTIKYCKQSNGKLLRNISTESMAGECPDKLVCITEFIPFPLGSGSNNGGSAGNNDMGGGNGYTGDNPPPACQENCNNLPILPPPGDNGNSLLISFINSLSTEQRNFWNSSGNEELRYAMQEYLIEKNYSTAAKDFVKWGLNYLIGNFYQNNLIENYLKSSNDLTIVERSNIIIDHLFNLKADISYQNFVAGYNQYNSTNLLWWDNVDWLNHPENFNLDPGDQYKRLTAEEKKLVKKYPMVAFTLSTNKDIAENKTVQKFGQNGLNDKSDAFRHAFFQALNTVRIGVDLAQQFADAHESEVPSQLFFEKQMDLFNNNIGIAFGQTVSPTMWNVNSLADQIFQKVGNGELMYLAPLDFVISPRWPAGLNGITQSTILRWTNQ